MLPTLLPQWIGTAVAETPSATTLTRTIVKGAVVRTGSTGYKYRRLVEGPGEAHMIRRDLIGKRWERQLVAPRRMLLSFVHMTDLNVMDAQSPARAEFLDRYGDSGGAAFRTTYRPQEIASVQVLDAMLRRVRKVSSGPTTGLPISFAITTGDNIDNAQFNELRWFIDAMDGGHAVTPNSGGPFYEGVMSAAWGEANYWHPGRGADLYKRSYGFRAHPGFIRKATSSVRASGVGIPWFQTVGNHDVLLQGNVPPNPFLDSVARGRAKSRGLPADVSPEGFQKIGLYVRTLLGDAKGGSPAAFPGVPVADVTPDPNRRVINREEYVREMFNTTGTPVGHGFTDANLPQADGSIASYWHSDAYPNFRMIGLDTVNPGGGEPGSIGDKQLQWLEQRLIEVSSKYVDSSGSVVSTGNADRLVLLFSHHGLSSLDSSSAATSDALYGAINDEPRHYADDVEALVHRFPNAIAWVHGHAGGNRVVPRRRGANRRGFWDIATTGHLDWASQARLIEVLDNSDGTLSIVATMVDHSGPISPQGRDAVLDTASVARELAANDPNGTRASGRGERDDRNVELILKAPFKLSL